MPGTSVIVGGNAGIGLAVARRRAERGDHVVVTSRSIERANDAAGELPGSAQGLALDLAAPHSLVDATEFLLTNTGIDGQDLHVDGGTLIT